MKSALFCTALSVSERIPGRVTYENARVEACVLVSAKHRSIPAYASRKSGTEQAENHRVERRESDTAPAPVLSVTLSAS